MDILQIKESEWARYRAIRIESLQESPNSFACNKDIECAQPEDYWREQLNKEFCFIVNDKLNIIDCALFCLAPASAAPPWLILDADCFLHSCWISPLYRRTSTENSSNNNQTIYLFPLIMKYVLNFCEKHHWQKITLAVFTDNEQAIRAYAKHAFEKVGSPQPSRKVPGRMYISMNKLL